MLKVKFKIFFFKPMQTKQKQNESLTIKKMYIKH